MSNENNDAGFRQFGRPDTIKAEGVDTERLGVVKEIEDQVIWLRSNVWAKDILAQRRRVDTIRKLLKEFDVIRT